APPAKQAAPVAAFLARSRSLTGVLRLRIFWLSVLWLRFEHSGNLFREAPGRAGQRRDPACRAEADRSHAPGRLGPSRRAPPPDALPCLSCVLICLAWAGTPGSRGSASVLAGLLRALGCQARPGGSLRPRAASRSARSPAPATAWWPAVAMRARWRTGCAARLARLLAGRQASGAG